jgi:hypothetical protein
VNLRRLAEIAALTALQSHHVIEADAPLGDDPLHQSLHNARDLQRLWRRDLDAAAACASKDREGTATALACVMGEVFVSDMLLRVWTAVLTAADACRSPGHAGPLARHVLLGVWDVRCRVLKLILDGEVLPLGSLYPIDRLRRRTERWCDLLIGRLAAEHDVLEFAFDARRAAEHSRERGDAAWPLVAAGIQAGFPADPVSRDRNAAHRGLASAILSVFPAASFDQDGAFRSRELQRYRALPADARNPRPLSQRAVPLEDDAPEWRTPLGIQFRKLFPRRDV